MFEPYEYTPDELLLVDEIYGSGPGGVHDSAFAAQIMDSETSAMNTQFSEMFTFKCGQSNLRQLLLAENDDCGNETTARLSRSKANPNEFTFTRLWLAASYQTGYQQKSMLQLKTLQSGAGHAVVFEPESGVAGIPMFVLPNTTRNRSNLVDIFGKPSVERQIESVDLFWSNQKIASLTFENEPELVAVATALAVLAEIVCKLSVFRIARAVALSSYASQLSGTKQNSTPDPVFSLLLTSTKLDQYLQFKRAAIQNGSVVEKIERLQKKANAATPFMRIRENRPVERQSFLAAKAAYDGLQADYKELISLESKLAEVTDIRVVQTIVVKFKAAVSRLILLKATFSAELLDQLYSKFRAVFDKAIFGMSNLVARKIELVVDAAVENVRPQNSYRFLQSLLTTTDQVQKAAVLYLLGNSADTFPRQLFPTDNPARLNKYFTDAGTDLLSEKKQANDKRKQTSSLLEATNYIYSALRNKSLSMKNLDGGVDERSIEMQVFDFFKQDQFLSAVNLGLAALSDEAREAVDILHRTLEQAEANREDGVVRSLRASITKTGSGAESSGILFLQDFAAVAEDISALRLETVAVVNKVNVGGDAAEKPKKTVVLLDLALLILENLRAFYTTKKPIDFSTILLPTELITEVQLQTDAIESETFQKSVAAVVKYLDLVQQALGLVDEKLQTTVTKLAALINDPQSFRRLARADVFITGAIGKIRQQIAQRIVVDYAEAINTKDPNSDSVLAKAAILFYAVVNLTNAEFVYIVAPDARALILERVVATENIYTEFSAKAILDNPAWYESTDSMFGENGEEERAVYEFKVANFRQTLAVVIEQRGVVPFKIPYVSEWENRDEEFVKRLEYSRYIQDSYWVSLYPRSEEASSSFLHDDPAFPGEASQAIKTKLLARPINGNRLDQMAVEEVSISDNALLIQKFGRLNNFTKATVAFLLDRIDNIFPLFLGSVYSDDKRDTFVWLEGTEKLLISAFNSTFGDDYDQPVRVYKAYNAKTLLDKFSDIDTKFGGKDDEIQVDDQSFNDADYVARQFKDIVKASTLREEFEKLSVVQPAPLWYTQLGELVGAATEFVGSLKALVLAIEGDKILIKPRRLDFQESYRKFEQVATNRPFIDWKITKKFSEIFTDILDEAYAKEVQGAPGEEAKERIAQEKALAKQLDEAFKETLKQKKEQQQQLAKVEKETNAQTERANKEKQKLQEEEIKKRDALLAKMTKINSQLTDKIKDVEKHVEQAKKELEKTENGVSDTGKLEEKVQGLLEKLNTYDSRLQAVSKTLFDEMNAGKDRLVEFETKFAEQTRNFTELIQKFKGTNVAKKTEIQMLVDELDKESTSLSGVIGDRENQNKIRLAENSLKEGEKQLKRLENLNDKLGPLTKNLEEENAKTLALFQTQQELVQGIDVDAVEAAFRRSVDSATRLKRRIQVLNTFAANAKTAGLAFGFNAKVQVLFSTLDRTIAAFQADLDRTNQAIGDVASGTSQTDIVQRKRPNQGVSQDDDDN